MRLSVEGGAVQATLDPASPLQEGGGTAATPIFGSCSLPSNGWMDQDAN